MPIKFDKLFKLMSEKGLSTYRIRKENIISQSALTASQSALTALNNNKGVTTDTIERLCRALNCQPGDLMEYVPDDSPDTQPEIADSEPDASEDQTEE